MAAKHRGKPLILAGMSMGAAIAIATNAAMHEDHALNVHEDHALMSGNCFATNAAVHEVAAMHDDVGISFFCFFEIGLFQYFLDNLCKSDKCWSSLETNRGRILQNIGDAAPYF